jgi:uroporphyrinogen-III synthase
MRVLFTRSLSDEDLDLCLKLALNPLIVPLITTESVSFPEVLVRYPDLLTDLERVTAVAFTSQHAVDALLGGLPPLRGGGGGFDNRSGGDVVGVAGFVGSPGDSDAAGFVGSPGDSDAAGFAGASGGSGLVTGQSEEGLSGAGDIHLHLIQKIRNMLRRKPVYTVGEVTADALDIHGIMARFPEDYNGTVLAEMMQYDGVHSAVMHFCGTVRRPEFYDAMIDAGIDVISVEVYRKGRVDANTVRAELGSVTETVRTESSSEATSPEMNLPQDVAAVAFYSPSAVHAFWDLGMHRNFGGSYFAIGTTTLAALKSLGANAHIPRVPTSELLIREIALICKS